VPPGYLDTLWQDTNVIVDANLGRYWDDVAAVTRAPIFSAGRWAAIWRLNIRTREGWMDDERYLYPNTKRVTLAALSRKNPDGSAWDADGNVVLDPVGGALVVTVGTLSRAARVEISVDHNDEYRVGFFGAGQKLGETEIGARPGAGMATHSVPTAPLARQRGFDELRVVASRGDGRFSVGHVALLESD